MSALPDSYVSERQVYRFLGYSDATVFHKNLLVLEANGFPKVDAIVGKRYGPAIVAWAEERNNRQKAQVGQSTPTTAEEIYNGFKF